MTVVGVIPARYDSTRLKAKVLADIAGKPMIQHVWERARKSKLLDELLIACDDERVKEEAEKFGAKAVLTSKDHLSGTDRVAEAVKNISAKIVVNIQGDEPLVQPSMIDGMAQALLEDQACPMATVIKRCESQEEVENPNVVKVVIDENNFALYFSRSPIPFNRDGMPFKKIVYFKHLGLYAFKKDFLLAFKFLPVSQLEKIEKLEQLRVLEAGYKIKTVETKYDTIAVDTRDDLKKVEEYFRKN